MQKYIKSAKNKSAWSHGFTTELSNIQSRFLIYASKTLPKNRRNSIF